MIIHTPAINEGKIIIKPPLDVDLLGRKAWENCLVGYFFEKRVVFQTMVYHANRKWKNRGLSEVIMNDEGFFFFKFKCEADLLEVLEEDVYMIEGKPLILQRWHSKIILTKNVPRMIPLWVKIFNVPLQYWNREGLSRIGSGIGNILLADSLTEKMCLEASGRLSFAKMLIEVDAKTELPEILHLHIPSDDFSEPLEVILRVEYPWRPSWCPTCVTFGHIGYKCPVLRTNQEKILRDSEITERAVGENEDYQIVHQKGKEIMGSNNGRGQQVGNFVASHKNKQNYSTNRNNGYWNDKRGGGDLGNGRFKGNYVQKRGPQGNRNGVSMSNKFEVLEGDIVSDVGYSKDAHEPFNHNQVDKGISNTRVRTYNKSPMNSSSKYEAYKDLKGGSTSRAQENDISKDLDSRVLEYLGQGSKLPTKTIALMEEEIEIRESKWDGRVVGMGEGICTTNSEAEVESDEGDTARFMVLDSTTDARREQNSGISIESDSSREQEQFAIEQLFGENTLEVCKEGPSNFVSQ